MVGSVTFSCRPKHTAHSLILSLIALLLSISPSLQALDNVPLLFYILALKTLVLCLGFAGVKIYQAKKEEAKLKIQRAEQRRIAEQVQELLDNELLDNKKDD